MKIEEAIKILSWENSQFPYATNPDFTDALELGIEALKVIRDNRGYPEYIIPRKLPGEDK